MRLVRKLLLWRRNLLRSSSKSKASNSNSTNSPITYMPYWYTRVPQTMGTTTHSYSIGTRSNGTDSMTTEWPRSPQKWCSQKASEIQVRNRRHVPTVWSMSIRRSLQAKSFSTSRNTMQDLLSLSLPNSFRKSKLITTSSQLNIPTSK